MSYVIYDEERFVALAKVTAHSEKDRWQTWDLEIVAILNEGINAHVREPIKVGDPVHLEGYPHNGYCPWHVRPSIARSAVGYYSPDHPIHERLAAALAQLPEPDQKALLEETHV